MIERALSSRRALGALAALVIASLALPGVAPGAPTISFKAEPIPIPGYHHTGYILGAGSALETEFHISGTEYGGFPPPLIGVNLYFPTGTKLHPAGFPTCAKATLEQTGPRGCMKGSAAGPVGHALGVVSFGNERVEEATTIESFFAPGGDLEFFTVGHSPTSLEILSTGHYLNLNGAGGYGIEFATEIPLIATVPGAPYAVVESINVEAGAARLANGKPVYYGMLPKSCPRQGFAVKAEMIFDEGGANPPIPETATVAYHAPCPRK